MGVIHPEGYAELRGDQINQTDTITLTPWVTVSGVSRTGNKPDVAITIRSYLLLNPLAEPDDESEGYINFNKRDIQWVYDIQTDAQGRFTMKLPQGGHKIGKFMRTNTQRLEMIDTVLLNLKAGHDIKDLQIGGQGRQVTASIVWKGNAAPWKTSYATLTLVPDENAPIMLVPLGDEPGPALEKIASQHGHGRAGPVVIVNQYNVLRAQDVKDGTYDLQIVFFGKLWPDHGEPLGVIQKRVVIAPAEQGKEDQPVDLGKLEVQPPQSMEE